MNLDWDKVFGVRPSISADPEVLRVLYERLKQRNEAYKAKAAAQRLADFDEFVCAKSYYTQESWRDQITVADAQFLADLDISPL